MKLFEFPINKDVVLQNQGELADTIRTLLYKENAKLFSKLNFDDDTPFLEPTLFYYFLATDKKLITPTLEQSLVGYILPKYRFEKFKAISDSYGFINLPGVGYLRTEPNKTFDILWNYESNKFSVEGYPFKYIEDKFIHDTRVRLCKHHTFLISQLSLDGKMVRFNESSEETLKNNLIFVEKALSMIKTLSRDFYELLILTTRELVILNSPNIYSMAAISYHGTAFINTEGYEHDEIFFIDDIAHQCGHIIFNALTLQTTNYLKVHKETFLRDFISEKREGRTVYSAFHGLFTYTTILYFLDLSLENFKFSRKQKHELIGRIGFYRMKFGNDLVSLTNSEIFTSKGLEFVEQFRLGYNYISYKYKEFIEEMNFEGSPYVFGYDFFKNLNPIENFDKKLA